MSKPLFDPQPVTLKGRVVTVCPLQMCHAEDLFHVGNYDDIWRYMPVPPAQSIRDTMGWINEALQTQQTGTQIPFAIVSNKTSRAIGSTRYLDIQRENRGLEIGWTWLSIDAQRTGVNTECKYLMLQNAFEVLRAVRVQFKTDGRNVQSQSAIEKIGAAKEGMLRSNRWTWDGIYRDTVVYSILESEWLCVKAKLETMMIRNR